ncbi:MAG: cobalamin-dependent protein [Thermoguttaceae bacterium]|nr:cobalamin-dependent protein [Thermoguttaceae bacterium]
MIRVLFGTPGWPSGLLEVGSWAVAQGLAQVVIRQIHPAKVLQLSAVETVQLCAGRVPDWLQERLEEAPLPTSDQAQLMPVAGGWIIQRPNQQIDFYILCRPEGAELFDATRLAWPDCRQAIGEYERATHQVGKFVYNWNLPLTGQSLSAELWDALGAVGGAFLDRLIRFRPHVIGFRLEGADEEQVASFIRACRLFSKAEIVLGGPTATSHPIEVLQDLGADYVFAGEAEETFAQFLRLARTSNVKESVVEIPGLAYEYGGRCFHNTLPADGYGRTAADPDAHPSASLSVSLRADLNQQIAGPSDPADRMAEASPAASGAIGLQNAYRHAAQAVELTPVGQLPPAFAESGEKFQSADPDFPTGWSQSWQRRHWVRPIASSAVLEANRLDWSLLEGFDRPMESLFFIGSRGCPGGCTFCAKLHGSQVRWKSAARLLEEIERADELVQAGRLPVQRWPLFAYTKQPEWQKLRVAWAAVYDEDFFLLRDRAIQFFRLWESSPLKYRYRLSFQTNPRSLLNRRGQVDQELFEWIDRLKPMIQLGGESFHPEQLHRWQKRHTVAQLQQVADALEATRQDYTVFILLSDFQSTPEEVVDAVWLLVQAALRRPGMRIASSPFTIPLYDSQTRRDLEYRGLLAPGRVRSYRDYLRPQPGWMNPWAAQLADRADAQLHFALQPSHRDAALLRAMEVLVETIRSWAKGERIYKYPRSTETLMAKGTPEAFFAPTDTPQPPSSPSHPALANRPCFLSEERLSQSLDWASSPFGPMLPKDRCRLLLHQAEWALEQVRELVFQLPLREPPPGNPAPAVS